jgi:membrane fusion protein (multidrug efflux system)
MLRNPLLLISAVFFCIMLSACSEPEANQAKKKPEHLVQTVSALNASTSIERERTGTLRAHQDIHIYSQEEGRITFLPFYEGDQVKAGDVVARLDDRLLYAQFKRAQALRSKAEKDLKRIRGLAKRKLAAEVELTRVETELAVAQADEQLLATRLDYTQIKAPIDGVISERLTEQGNIVERYSHLLTISDQSSLITELNVSALLINKLHLGDDVSMTIDALAGIQDPEASTVKGKITRIYPTLDPVTRTGIVEIALSPVPQGAMPGQLARVKLKTQEAIRLLIPFSALRRSSKGEYVYIIGEDNRAHIRFVVSGLKIGEQIEILGGIEEGERVVTRGYTNLHNDTQVRVIDGDSAPVEFNDHANSVAPHEG